jgi:hypothetical protein
MMTNSKYYAKYKLALKGEREDRRPAAAVESEQARSQRKHTHFEEICPPLQRSRKLMVKSLIGEMSY